MDIELLQATLQQNDCTDDWTSSNFPATLWPWVKWTSRSFKMESNCTRGSSRGLHDGYGQPVPLASTELALPKVIVLQKWPYCPGVFHIMLIPCFIPGTRGKRTMPLDELLRREISLQTCLFCSWSHASVHINLLICVHLLVLLCLLYRQTSSRSLVKLNSFHSVWS